MGHSDSNPLAGYKPQTASPLPWLQENIHLSALIHLWVASVEFLDSSIANELFPWDELLILRY